MDITESVLGHMRDLETKGYCILKNVLDKDLVKEAEAKVRRDLKANPNCWDLYGKTAKGKLKRANSFIFWPEFMHVLDIPIIHSINSLCCGYDYRVDHILTIKSNAWAENVEDVQDVALHQLHGGPFSNGGLNHWLPGFPLDVPFPRCGRLNLSIPLTPAGKAIGNAVLMEGSHVYRDYLCCVESSSGLGGAPLSYLQNLEKTCPVVIPEVEPGDVFFFADALFHGTTVSFKERMTIYFMLAKGTSCLQDYSNMAKPYFEAAETNNQRIRFLPPWYFSRKACVYAENCPKDFSEPSADLPFPGCSDGDRIKAEGTRISYIRKHLE